MHNSHVVAGLRARGAIFVNELDEVPDPPLEIVSCPGCGRLQVDLYTLTAKVQTAFDGFPHPLRVAVMGCVVNGPGEAREADLGVASGNGKGQIFIKGKVVDVVPEARITETLFAMPCA